MKSTLIAALTLFASVALAQPRHANKRHGHGVRHEKRDIVWVTEIDVVTETVDITSTVWVDADATIPPSVSPSSSVTTTDAKFFTTLSPEPVKPATTLSSVYVAPPAPTTSTSAYVAPPAPASTFVAPPPPPPVNTPVYVTPVVVSTPEPAPAPASTYVAPVVVAPAASPSPTPTPEAVVSSSSNTASSGYTGTCATGSKCTGEITFYDTGLGACGWNNDGMTERVVALPAGLMGAQSNGNPFCGMTITISKGGKTTTAKVVDKCPGCSGNAIDLSKMAFDDLADQSIGRTTADWWFN